MDLVADQHLVHEAYAGGHGLLLLLLLLLLDLPALRRVDGSRLGRGAAAGASVVAAGVRGTSLRRGAPPPGLLRADGLTSASSGVRGLLPSPRRRGVPLVQARRWRVAPVVVPS